MLRMPPYASVACGAGVAVRVAVVGSREFPDMGKVRAFVSGLEAGTTIISGGSRGVDTVAERTGRARGLRVEVHLPDWWTHPRAAGVIRNQKIVDSADRVVAFWDGHSRGTADTIKRARAKGIPIEVVTAEKP